MKPNYNKAEHLARQLILKQRYSAFNIDPKCLVLSKNIIFESFQNYSTKVWMNSPFIVGRNLLDSGCLLKYKGINLILYNDTIKKERLKWTLAHELGHVLLEHKKDTSVEEIEANCFATELLMPQIVMLELNCLIDGRLDARIVCDMFGVSKTAARKRCDALANRFASYRRSESPILGVYEQAFTSFKNEGINWLSVKGSVIVYA